MQRTTTTARVAVRATLSGPRRTLLLACCALVVAACAAETTPAPEAMSSTGRTAPTADDGVERVVIESTTPAALGAYAGAILPAYQTAAEALLEGANDAASDYRAAHIEWFANTVPAEKDRYRPYGEWETMSGVWTTYSSGMPSTPAVRRMFAEQTIAFIRHSAPKVKAYVVVPTGSLGVDFVKAVDTYGITSAEKQWLSLVTLPNQTIWMMDYSGFPLIDKKSGQLAFADWIYYGPRYLDDALGVRIPLEFYDANVYRAAFPFEGGNIQADGVGACATTTRALSNTGFSATKVRNILANYAGCKSTYILKDITDDGTGHLDMFFKWVDTDHVLIGRYDDQITADVDLDGKTETVPMPGKVAPSYKATFNLNQQRMDDNAAVFAAASSLKGTKFKVSRIPMMTRFKDEYGDLPRTFINSTFTNGVNVYPSYATASCQDPQGSLCQIDADCGSADHCAAGRCTPGPTATGCDEIVGCGKGTVCKKDGLKVALTAAAQSAWEAAMPSWKHVGLRADTIALWSGAIHCITRTVPVAPKGKAIADGLCIGGSCSCVEGGAKQACSSDSTCVGPTWRCACAVCKGKCGGAGSDCSDDADCPLAGGAVVDGSCVFDASQTCGSSGSGGGCGDVSYEGTCNGKQLSYCDGGLKQQTCEGCCGWEQGSGYYNCLSGGICGGCISECATGSGGCSSEGTHAWTCDSSSGCNKRVWTPCSKGCSGGVCAGGGGGGSSGGVCPGADAGGADAGGVDAGSADAGSADTSGGTDAASSDSGGSSGGDASQIDMGADDAGPNCQPLCAGKQCGPDGCGGSCGGCGAGESCATTGLCVKSTCVPVCGAKKCGSDGCGGSCGTCPFGLSCGPSGQCGVAGGGDAGSSGDAGASDGGGADAGKSDGGGGDGGVKPGDDGGGGGDGGDGAGGGNATDAAAADGSGLQSDGVALDSGANWTPGVAPSSTCSARAAGRGDGRVAWLVLLCASALWWRRRRAEA